MMMHWRSFLVGLLGMLVGLLAWHAWQDHVVFHQLLALLNQQAAQTRSVK